MEEFTIIIWIAAIAISIWMVIVFFRMSIQLTAIKKSIDAKSHQYWEDEYKKHLFIGNDSQTKVSLYNHMYYYIKSHNNDVRKRMYSYYKKHNEDKFIKAGIEFPEWNESIFVNKE